MEKLERELKTLEAELTGKVNNNHMSCVCVCMLLCVHICAIGVSVQIHHTMYVVP